MRLDEPHLIPREIGSLRGEHAGPTLICVGGTHGNEPAGLFAGARVLDRLAATPRDLRGELVVFAGNLTALRAEQRYRAKDLNRVWTERRICELHARPDESGDDPEDLEQRELLEVIEAAILRARGQVYFMDLHTTSAPGIPFVLFGDTLKQRAFAREYPLPIVLGLEEQVDGVMSEYFTHHGCITLTIEGGQHDDPASADNLEAAIWIALVSAGLVSREPFFLEHSHSYALLDSRRKHLPRVMEVVRRHAITPGDGFVMAPGFANLDHASRGQLLARDRRGDIRAPCDGLVILPLYQGQGDDGFFWGRGVSAARLAVSEVLRRVHLDRALPLVRGVTRDPLHRDRLCVDARAARWLPLDVFHAFGYRRIREREGGLLVGRQPG